MGRKAAFFSDFSNMDFGFSTTATSVIEDNGIFLNTLSETDVRSLMKKCGLNRVLRQAGFFPFIVDIQKDENDFHNLSILTQDRTQQLIDLRLSEKRLVVAGIPTIPGGLNMVGIEWLSTSNPTLTEFSQNRPQLPGQKSPSLGCLVEMMKMMYYFSKKVKKDGFMDVPDHLHLALMYSKKFKYLNPVKEGEIRSLLESLHNYSLADIAWASITGAIIDLETKTTYNYRPDQQIFPVSLRMKRYFSSRKYRRGVKQNKSGPYTIDRNILNSNKKKLLKCYSISEL